VNTGANHADLTDDYAEVPAEMRSVAAALGQKALRFCDRDEFFAKIPALRASLGDRAVLRAMHFFNENDRVNAQKAALNDGDLDAFLALVSRSGDSSFKYLQNVYTNRSVAEQGISLALALSEQFGAVCRVHGGGFAGTIQAYVPDERVAEYKKELESVFGAGSCYVARIRSFGAAAIDDDGNVNDYSA